MTKIDKDLCKLMLRSILHRCTELPYESCTDMVDECERVINDVKSGERDDYLCPADVLSDYLGLSDDYLPIFE